MKHVLVLIYYGSKIIHDYEPKIPVLEIYFDF